MNRPLIIAAVDGYVAAVDRNNGQVVWRHDLHDPRVEARFRNRTTITLELPGKSGQSVGLIMQRVERG